MTVVTLRIAYTVFKFEIHSKLITHIAESRDDITSKKNRNVKSPDRLYSRIINQHCWFSHSFSKYYSFCDIIPDNDQVRTKVLSLHLRFDDLAIKKKRKELFWFGCYRQLESFRDLRVMMKKSLKESLSISL